MMEMIGKYGDLILAVAAAAAVLALLNAMIQEGGLLDGYLQSCGNLICAAGTEVAA